MFTLKIGEETRTFDSWADAMAAAKEAKANGIEVVKVNTNPPTEEEAKKEEEKSIISKPPFLPDAAKSADVVSETPAQSTESKSEDSFSDVDSLTNASDLLQVTGNYAEPGQYLDGPAVSINYDQIKVEAGLPLEEVEEVEEPVKEGRFGFKTNDQILKERKEKDANEKLTNPKDEQNRAYFQKINQVENLAVTQLLDESGEGIPAIEGLSWYNNFINEGFERKGEDTESVFKGLQGKAGIKKQYVDMVMQAFKNGGNDMSQYRAETLVEDYFETKRAQAVRRDNEINNEAFIGLEESGQTEVAFNLAKESAIARMDQPRQEIANLNNRRTELEEKINNPGELPAAQYVLDRRELKDVEEKQDRKLQEVRETSLLKFNKDGEIIGIKTEVDSPMYDAKGRKLNTQQVEKALSAGQTLYGASGDAIGAFGDVLDIEGLNTLDKVKNQFVTNSVRLTKADALADKVVYLKGKSALDVLWNPGMYNRGVAQHQLEDDASLQGVLENNIGGKYNGLRKKDEDGYIAFTVGEVAEAIALGDWKYGDFDAKGLEGTDLASNSDFVVFHEDRRNMAIKQSVLEDMIVLGADLSTLEKDDAKSKLTEFGRNAAINLPFVGNQLRKDIGTTERVYKDQIQNVFADLGIAETDEMKENFKRSFSMHLAEGAGAFVPVLGEFAVVNYLTGGLASATGLTSVTNTLLKSRNLISRLGGHFLKGVGEEIKFKLVTKGESKTGSGFGFYVGGGLTRQLFRNIRIAPNKNYANPVNKAFQNIVLGGIGGATAGEAALVTEAFYDQAMGNQSFRTSMEEMFGEDVDVWQRWAVGAVQFGMLGGYNNFKMAYNRASLSEVKVLNDKYKVELKTAKKNKANKYTINKLEEKVEATDNIIGIAEQYVNLRSIKWLKQQKEGITRKIDELTKEVGGGNYREIKIYKDTYIKHTKRIAKLEKQAKAKAESIMKDHKGLSIKIEKTKEGQKPGEFDQLIDGKREITYDPDKLTEGVFQHEMGHDAIVELANTPEGQKYLTDMVESIDSKVEAAWKRAGNKNSYKEYLEGAIKKGEKDYHEEYIMRLVQLVKEKPVLASNLLSKGVFKDIQRNIQQFARNSGLTWAEGKFNMSEPNSPHRADNVLNMIYRMANAKGQGYRRNKEDFNALKNLFVDAKTQQNTLGENLNPPTKATVEKKFSEELENNESFQENSRLNKEINEKFLKNLSSKSPKEIGEDLQFDFLSRIEGLMKVYLKKKDLNLRGNTEFGSNVAKAQEGIVSMEAVNFIMDTRTTKQKEAGGEPLSLGDAVIVPYVEGQNLMKTIRDNDLSIEETMDLFEKGGYATGGKTKEQRVKDIHDMATGKKPEGALTTYVHQAVNLMIARTVDSNIKANEKEVFLEGDQTMEFLSNEFESRGEEFDIQAEAEVKRIDEAYTVKEEDQGYSDRAGENRRTVDSAMDILSIKPETRTKVDKIVDEELSKPIEGLEAQAIGTIDLGNGKVYQVEIPTEKNRALTFDSKGEREEHRSFQKPKDLAIKLQKREKAKAVRESIDQSKTPEQRAEAKAEADRLDRLVYKKDFNFVKDPTRLFKVKLERTVEEALYEDIRAEMGEVGSKENLYWLAKTHPLMKNYIGLSQITKRFAGLYEPVMVEGKDGKLRQAREKTAAGAKIFKRTEISQADYFEYFKNDVVRQVSLAKALAREFAFDKVVDKIASGAAENIVLRQGGREDLAKLEEAGKQMIFKHIQRGGTEGFLTKFSKEIDLVAEETGVNVKTIKEKLSIFGRDLSKRGVEAFNTASEGADYMLRIIQSSYTDMWIQSAKESNDAQLYKNEYREDMKSQYDPMRMEVTPENVKVIDQRASDVFSVIKTAFRESGVYDIMKDVGVSKTDAKNSFDFIIKQFSGFTGERMFDYDYRSIIKNKKEEAKKEYLKENPKATKKEIDAHTAAAVKPYKKVESQETHPPMGPQRGRELWSNAKEGLEDGVFKDLKEVLSSDAFTDVVKNLGEAAVDARTKMEAFRATDKYVENFQRRGKGKNGKKGNLSEELDNVTANENQTAARRVYLEAAVEAMLNAKGRRSDQDKAEVIEAAIRKEVGDKGFVALEAEQKLLEAGNTFMLSLLGKLNLVKTPEAQAATQQLANMMYHDNISGFRSTSPFVYVDTAAIFKPKKKGIKPDEVTRENLNKIIGNEHVRTRTAFFADVFKNLRTNKPGEGLDNPLVVKGMVEGYWSLLGPEFKQKLVDGLKFPKGSEFNKGVVVKSAAVPEYAKMMLTLADAKTTAEMQKVWDRLGPKGSGPEMEDMKRLFFGKNLMTNKTYLEKLVEDFATEAKDQPVKELASAAEINKKYSKEIEGANEDMNGKQLVEALSIEEIKAQREKDTKGRQLEKELAGMIERKGGAPEEALVSNSKAYMSGKKRMDDLFLPSSSEDLQGLLYKPYGKGKQGDADMEFMNEHILRPLTKAENALSVYRMRLAEDYAGLERQIKEMGETKPEKDAVRRVEELGYNIDQAVRVYIWQQLGMKIPGISVSERSQLFGAVMQSKKLRAYADGIMNITKTKEKYPEPKENWFRSNVQYDLFTHATDGVRADFLYEWQENVDAMFTKENLNKLEARFGGKYRYNLEQMLHRIKIGKSRPESTNEAFNTTLNYINGSVATIMFLNMRSAALQTISAANYINWTDNNPLKIAKIVGGDPKKFLETAKMIWSSDALRDRRTGLKINVQEAEMAKAIKSGGRTAAQTIWDQMVQIGFKPTQMADSFAIVMGGTPFYMNRLKTYEAEGMSKNEAADRAYEDFLDKTQEGQQSSQMDRVSNIQTGLMGRLVFSFNNTPFQMSRLQKKAFLDLKNRRGDTKTNVSRMAYYGLIQSSLFYGLQQAFYGSLMSDDAELSEEELDEKYRDFDKRLNKMGNSVWQGILTGSGLPGKGAVVAYNTAMEAKKQYDKGYQGADFFPILSQIMSLSPTLGSKVNRLGRNWKSLIMAEHTKKGREFGNTFNTFDPRNPNAKAYISMIGTATNIPVDRLITKMENISDAIDANNELWQRAAMLMGTPKYQLQTKEQNTRDRQQIIDDFYMENTPKATRDIDAIEMLNVKEQKAWLKEMGASDYFVKQLLTQGDRTRAIAYITNELGLDIEKEWEKYDIPVPVYSPEYKKIQDLKKDGQIELLRSYGASKYAIQKLDNEEKRIKLILSIQTQRENSLK